LKKSISSIFNALNSSISTKTYYLRLLKSVLRTLVSIYLTLKDKVPKYYKKKKL